jgi:pyruvate-ferredoxin/flavodoxin oxidoreductase
MLQRTNPVEAERMLKLAQQIVNQKWDIYEQMATSSGSQFHPDANLSS